MTHFDKKLTEDETAHLKRYNAKLNPWRNLKDGDSVDWEFNPAAVEEIEDNFGNTKTQFRVYDPNTDEEGIWQIANKWAARVTPFLNQGVNFLHIERRGATQSDTEYRVEAAK